MVAVFASDPGSVGASVKAPELRHWADDSLIPLAANDLPALSVAFSPDGALFAASTGTGVNVWRVLDGSLLRQVPGLAGEQAISLSTAGDVIAGIPVNASAVQVWRLADPSNVQTLVGNHPPMQFISYQMYAVAVSPDGTLVVMTYLADIQNFTHFVYTDAFTTVDGAAAWSIYYGANGPVPTGLIFSPDGQTLATSSGTFAAATGTALHSFSTVYPSMFSSDGTTIAGLVPNVTPQRPVLVNASDGTVVQSPTLPTGETLVGVGAGPSPSNSLRIVDRTQTNFVYEENGVSVSSRDVYSFLADGEQAISADGRFVAIAAFTTPETLLWDTSTDTPTQSWPTSGPLVFSPDGATLFVLEVPSWDATVDVQVLAMPLAAGGLSYDVDTGGKLLTDFTLGPSRLGLSPSGALLAFPGPQNTAQLRRATDGGLVAMLWDTQGHTDIVTAVAFSPDEKWVATGSRDMRIRLWDTTTGTGGQFLTGAVAGIEALAFTPDGSSIVSSDANGDLRVWNIASGATTAMTNVKSLVDLAVSPDGSVVYVTSGLSSDYTDDHLQRFHLPDLAPLSSVPGHRTGAGRLALSADGSRLASSYDNQTVRVDCVK